MSGGSGGGPWRRDSGADCSKLGFTTVLASPRAPAISAVAVKDVADVELCKEKAGQFVGVILHSNRTVVGSITDHVPELLRCLQAGHTFSATFTKIAGGKYTIKVGFVR